MLNCPDLFLEQRDTPSLGVDVLLLVLVLLLGLLHLGGRGLQGLHGLLPGALRT